MGTNKSDQPMRLKLPMKNRKLTAKVLKYLVPSLAAAGSLAFGADTQPGKASNPESAASPLLKNAKSLVSELESQQVYTLAQHSSHSSHGSHSSHSSHSSGGGRSISIDDEEFNELETRNYSSTPTSSVLPSSPALVEQRKLKILPGNSENFTNTVIQVQLALASKGFDVGAIDGSLHARSIAAIYEYQSSAGIPSDGKLSPTTLASLGIVAN